MGESREREREEREREREEREREREERERERERYRPRSPVSRPTARPATLFVSFSAWSAWRQHQHPRSHSHCCCCLLFVAPSSFLRGSQTSPATARVFGASRCSPKLNLVCCSLNRRQSASFVS